MTNETDDRIRTYIIIPQSFLPCIPRSLQLTRAGAFELATMLTAKHKEQHFVFMLEAIAQTEQKPAPVESETAFQQCKKQVVLEGSNTL